MAEGKKGRKIGRMKNWCLMYRNSRRREINKAIHLLRHIHRLASHDKVNNCALNALNKLMLGKTYDQLLKARTWR